MDSSIESAKELVEYIDEQDDAVYDSLSNWDVSATVITVGNGTAEVHLPTDPVGTNITVYNPNEISLEVGDQVTIHKIDGNINNAYVLFRKTVTFDNIYVDYATGTNAFGRDSSGNLYGSSSAPFKTLQYAINRLPKNLNGRIIYVYYSNPDSNEDLFIDGLYGGGTLYIIPLSGTSVSYIHYIYITGCYGIEIDIKYLGANKTDGAAIWIRRCSFVQLDTCNVVAVAAGHYGIDVDDGSKCHIRNTTISSRYVGIFVESVSDLFSENNSGSNVYGLGCWYSSSIGRTGTYPTGTTADQWTDSSSVIR